MKFNFKFTRNDSIKKIKNYENFLLRTPVRKIAFQDTSKKFCIVIPSYNNEEFILSNINSVFLQKYNNWKIIYIDDASTDNTLKIAYKIREIWKIPSERFEIFSHKEKISSPAYSFYLAANNYCNDDDIMVHLDGDDMLAGDNVLSKLFSLYENNNIWLTFGSFLSTHGTMRIDANKYNVTKNLKNIRNSPWITSHLRTSYTWLFKKIAIEDLKYENNFIKYANDVAMMLPMIEMAGPDRSYYLEDILYLYRIHSNNIFKSGRELQSQLEKYIRSKPSYTLLQENYIYEHNPNRSIDNIYVMNLDQATKRWNVTSALLAKEEIAHQRFSATYGYDIKIIDLASNRTFLGQSLKEKTNQIKKGKKYRIICDPNNQNSIEFDFYGYSNHDKSLVSAGELGCWCSTKKIWEDIYINQYRYAIIFEDDIVPIDNFTYHLNNYLNNLPENFDIGYLAATIANNTKNPFYNVNNYVYGFNNHTRGWGGFGYIITDKAVDKLRNITEFSFPTDIFYWCLSGSKMPIVHHYKDCKKYGKILNNYLSSLRLVEVRRVMDEDCINNMGRNQTKIELKVPSKIYSISHGEVINKEVEIGERKFDISYFPTQNNRNLFEKMKINFDLNGDEYYEVQCSSEVSFKVRSNITKNDYQQDKQIIEINSDSSPLLQYSVISFNIEEACSLASILDDIRSNNFTNIMLLRGELEMPKDDFSTIIHNLIEYTDNYLYFDASFKNTNEYPYGMIIKNYENNEKFIDLTSFYDFIL